LSDTHLRCSGSVDLGSGERDPRTPREKREVVGLVSGWCVHLSLLELKDLRLSVPRTRSTALHRRDADARRTAVPCSVHENAIHRIYIALRTAQ
jgi:hypothetical protein